MVVKSISTSSDPVSAWANERSAAAAARSFCQLLFVFMVCCPSAREDMLHAQLLQFVILCVLVRVRLTRRLYAK